MPVQRSDDAAGHRTAKPVLTVRPRSLDRATRMSLPARGAVVTGGRFSYANAPGEQAEALPTVSVATAENAWVVPAADRHDDARRAELGGRPGGHRAPRAGGARVERDAGAGLGGAAQAR